MIDDIKKLARKNIQHLKPYQSARRIGGQGDVWLNANESPISVFFSITKSCFNRYPECQPKKLIFSYAKYVNLSSKKILATRGADEGIELLIKAFCQPGEDAIIYCPPTYDMYRISAKIAGVLVKEIPVKENNWQIDLSNIASNLKKVKLIYICNPNNPTGTVILKEDIIHLLKITTGKALIVVDEAYIEFFLIASMVDYLQFYSNLVILRTLSKSFALAGIRCGFVLANQEIITILNSVISPYPISTPVSNIAIEALKENSLSLMNNRILEINNNRLWLVEQLKNFSFVEKIFISHANYVLVKFTAFEIIFNILQKKGIILRKQNEKRYLNNCIRISIGTRCECILLIKELQSLFIK